MVATSKCCTVSSGRCVRVRRRLQRIRRRHGQLGRRRQLRPASRQPSRRRWCRTAARSVFYGYMYLRYLSVCTELAETALFCVVSFAMFVLCGYCACYIVKVTTTAVTTSCRLAVCHSAQHSHWSQWLTVTVVYRPPSSSSKHHRVFVPQLSELLEELMTLPGQLVVCGDFNWTTSIRRWITAVIKTRTTGTTAYLSHLIRDYTIYDPPINILSVLMMTLSLSAKPSTSVLIQSGTHCRITVILLNRSVFSGVILKLNSLKLPTATVDTQRSFRHHAPLIRLQHGARPVEICYYWLITGYLSYKTLCSWRSAATII